MEKLFDVMDLNMESIISVIDTVGKCIEGYLFVREIETKRIYLSKSITNRFAINEYDFIDEGNIFEEQLIYQEDQKMVLDLVIACDQNPGKEFDMLYRWNGRNGDPIWVHGRGQMIRDKEGKVKYFFGATTEIGRKMMADDISGLKGEVMLMKAYESLLAQGKRGFVVRIGIDNFKEINENHGTMYGDMIIRQTAECIKRATGGLYEVYRITADEYVVLDFNSDNINDVMAMYERASFAVNDFIISNNYDSFYTISAGIVDTSLRSNVSYESIMRRADFALNEAKARGKNQCYEFDKDDYAKFKHNRQLLSELRRSVAEGFEGFDAFFQPIVESRNQTLVGAETLMRYTDMDGNSVTPFEFIPLLEESGLIIPAGRWIVGRAVEMCKKMQEVIPSFYISVNISYVQLKKSNLLDLLINAKNKMNLPDNSIVVEITESGEIECDDSFLYFSRKLRENGILLALDDFGTGYSNFHYLYKLRPDTMKIDRSFTLSAINDDYEMKLLKYTSDMAHSIGLKTIIEGVETDDELEKITNCVNPDYIQGYYFGKPMKYDDFMSYAEKYID